MFKLISVIAILAATYQVQYSIELVTLLILLISTLFYGLAFKLFVGLLQSIILKEVDILGVLTSQMIYFIMMLLTYQSQYYMVALIALPWLIIQTLINTVSILITLGYIEIRQE